MVAWPRGRGELRKTGAVTFSFDLSGLSRELRYRYRLFLRPHVLVVSNPAICSGQPVFRGTRIPVSVVVEQLRSGVSRIELEADFPQRSRQALDYAQIQARLPRPPGRPRQPLTLHRGCSQSPGCWLKKGLIQTDRGTRAMAVSPGSTA